MHTQRHGCRVDFTSNVLPTLISFKEDTEGTGGRGAGRVQRKTTRKYHQKLRTHCYYWNRTKRSPLSRLVAACRLPQICFPLYWHGEKKRLEDEGIGGGGTQTKENHFIFQKWPWSYEYIRVCVFYWKSIYNAHTADCAYWHLQPARNVHTAYSRSAAKLITSNVNPWLLWPKPRENGGERAGGAGRRAKWRK